MGGEWSKAVGMIFKQKYSNGRGKLQDAMKDPETKVLHEQLKSGKKVKVGKTRKMRGGNTPLNTNHEEDNNEDDEEEVNDGSLEAKVAAIEAKVAAIEALLRNQGIMMTGGFPAKSKKSRKVKSRRN